VDGSWLPDIGQELLVKRKRPAGDAGMQEASSRKILVLDEQVMLPLDFASQ
jgi:hypothetical protein